MTDKRVINGLIVFFGVILIVIAVLWFQAAGSNASDITNFLVIIFALGGFVAIAVGIFMIIFGNNEDTGSKRGR